MSQLLPIVVFLVWIGLLLWRRSVNQRALWLRRLNLPGTWTWEDGDSSLSLPGELATGSFLLREGKLQCSGRWRLRGRCLELSASRGELKLGTTDPYLIDVRRFESGRLGLDAPGREKRVYRRSIDNVVPLRGNR